MCGESHEKQTHVSYYQKLEIIVDNLFSKRCQCQSHQPEVHLTPGEADDGYTKQQAKAEMGQCNSEATDEEPKNVHEQTEASAILRLVHNMRAKWP